MSDTPHAPEPETGKAPETPPHPAPAPEPTRAPAPAPEPAPTQQHGTVTRDEFATLTGTVNSLVESVNALVDKITNSNPITHSKPTKPPWTHAGWKAPENPS